MGYIKEPKGIDFVIKSEPLTDEAKNKISEFIKLYKSKKQSKKLTKSKENLLNATQ